MSTPGVVSDLVGAPEWIRTIDLMLMYTSSTRLSYSSKWVSRELDVNPQHSASMGLVKTNHMRKTTPKRIYFTNNK